MSRPDSPSVPGRRTAHTGSPSRTPSRPRIASGSSGAQQKLIAVDVLEDRHRAVRHPLRLQDELDAFAFELTGRPFHIVTPESDIQNPARPQRVAELKQHDSCVGAWNPEFEPSLLVAEGLIGEQAESQ